MKMTMGKTILLLGSTGKMGLALGEVFALGNRVIGKNSSDFDAGDFEQVSSLIDDAKPDIVINTTALIGIDPCELDPARALHLNALLPRHLATISTRLGFTLVHFSTDAVFGNEKRAFFCETDTPAPVNIYGFTKYGGDCFVANLCERHYILRIPTLFGKSIKKNQFVEKMLARISAGDKTLRVSDDIFSSPSYSSDVAERAHDMILGAAPFGTYHLANEGAASLYQLMEEVISCLELDVVLERASYRDFSYVGTKNVYTPLQSCKTESLRPWRDAVRAYCQSIDKREL